MMSVKIQKRKKESVNKGKKMEGAAKKVSRKFVDLHVRNAHQQI